MFINIGKTGKGLNVNWDAMPDNAKAFIIEYGLRQKLNDAGAGITAEVVPDDTERAEQKLGAAEVVLAALMSGDISTRQAARSQSLEEKEFSKCLKNLFKTLLKRNLSTEPDTSDEALLELIAKHTEKPVERIRAAVEKQASALVELERQKAMLPKIDI